MNGLTTHSPLAMDGSMRLSIIKSAAARTELLEKLATLGGDQEASFEQAFEAMRPKSRVVEPDQQSTKEYGQFYEKWFSVHGWLDRLSEEMG